MKPILPYDAPTYKGSSRGGTQKTGACGARACVLLPKGCVFAAENRRTDGYTLISCMTAPQFSESGCRLIGRDELKALCPEQFDALARLAR